MYTSVIKTKMTRVGISIMHIPKTQAKVCSLQFETNYTIFNYKIDNSVIFERSIIV